MISHNAKKNATAEKGFSEVADGVAALTPVLRGPCLSVIIPLKTKPPERIQNHNLVRHAADKARELLDKVGDGREEISIIKKQFESALTAIDFNHLKEGIGFFISPVVSQQVDFSFPVPERIMLGESFESRDVFYMAQAQRAYYVLSLTAQYIRLFLASGSTLSEIEDGFFPCRYIDTHQYARPVRVRSYSGVLKGFEKDKGTMAAMRIAAFLKNVDKKLQRYIAQPESEVVLAGQSRMIAAVEILAHVRGHVAGKVPETYASTGTLSAVAWDAVQSHRRDEERRLVNRVMEAAPELRVSGIEEVEEAARFGQGLLLVVERNFRYPSMQARPGNSGELAEPVADLVDDVIETVYLKGGRVVFVEDDELGDSGRIVLLLRYR